MYQKCLCSRSVCAQSHGKWVDIHPQRGQRLHERCRHRRLLQRGLLRRPRCHTSRSRGRRRFMLAPCVATRPSTTRLPMEYCAMLPIGCSHPYDSHRLPLHDSMHMTPLHRGSRWCIHHNPIRQFNEGGAKSSATMTTSHSNALLFILFQ